MADQTVNAGKNILVIHTTQFAPHTSYSSAETKNYLRLQPDNAYEVISRKIDGNATVELCVALYWSELAAANLDIDIAFSGVVPHNATVAINSGAGFTRVNLHAAVSEVCMGARHVCGYANSAQSTMRVT